MEGAFPVVGILQKEESHSWDGSRGGPARARFRGALLGWFDGARRDLPWRGEHDPYRVWVSEAMLQQTRAEVVRLRYPEFLRRFPDVQALAAAKVEDVLAAWSGLGYYARARSLSEAARRIVHDHGGRFPRELSVALSLPGIGPYMARAILSIAHDRALAVVDGNVVRVVSRFAMIHSNRPASAIQAEADRLLDHGRPGDWNQAMMDLGATICLSTSPKCGECPIGGLCRARKAGRVADFPPRREKNRPTPVDTTLWIAIDPARRIWIERRTLPPLRGLWMLPWREADVVDETASSRIGALDHAIMDRIYRCQVHRIEVPGVAKWPRAIPGKSAGPGRWIGCEEIGGIPHPSLLDKALRLLDPPPPPRPEPAELQ